MLRGAVALLVPLFDDDELLRGADALLVPVFDEEFALGPPMRLVRPDRVCLVGAGIRVPGVEVPEPDGGPGSAREPDVLRVSAMHAGRTPPSTPFSLYLNAIFPFRLSLIRQKRTAEQVPKRFVFDVAENPTPEMGNNLAHDTRC